MRLAFLLYKYFPYGGMQRDFRRFVEESRKRGHQCRVYYISWQGDVLPDTELRRVPVRALSNPRRNTLYYQWVQEDLARDPVDGVIGFNKMPGLDVYYAADSCYLDKALNERGWLYRRGARYRHFADYERAVFSPESDTEILLISDTERLKFENHYATPASRLHMLPPGISPDRREPADAPARRKAIRRELGIEPGDHVMLFVGSGFIKKGLDRAIQALANIAEDQPSVRMRLLVVGQDKPRRFQRLCRRLGVADAVTFLGGRDDVPDLLLGADTLVHPALDEAAGIVLLEALVAGLPIVVTDVCGYAHHIAQAGAGLVLPSPFQQVELDEAIMRMLDGFYRVRCKESALKYAQETDLYSMHSSGAKLIEEFIANKLERSSD
ncbi:MAG: glycosyltransferase family 4 protein [Halioglobus sp.]